MQQIETEGDFLFLKEVMAPSIKYFMMRRRRNGMKVDLFQRISCKLILGALPLMAGNVTLRTSPDPP
jgi:hypothetical protein